MMTIENFENQIESTILKRGKEYFLKGNVEFFEEIKKNNWAAGVVGTDDYQIEIQLGSKGEIKSYECTCPYDYSAECKHIVAVLYTILKQKTTEVILEKIVEKPSKDKKMSFEALLEKISLKEYQDFIKQYSKKDRNFKDTFELHFAEKDNTFNFEKKYTDLIKKAIKSHTSRGFIDYYASNKLGKELGKYGATIQQYLTNKNYRDAFVLCKVLVREVCPVFEYCDDSNGYVAGCAEETFTLLSQLIEATVSLEFKEQIAHFVKEELQNPIYFDYGDFGYTLIDMYADLSINIYKPNDFIEFIDAKIHKAKSYDYDRNFFIKQKVQFLSKIGRENELQELIHQNIEISEIRAIEINNCIEEGEYDKAKQLLSEGIKIAEKKQHSGTVYQWEKELLKIAVLQKDLPMICYFSRKFAFDGGLNTTYYNQWKNTFHKEKWKKVIEKEIATIINKVNEASKKSVLCDVQRLNSAKLYHLAPIYIQENYFDRLFELVQIEQNLDNVLTYYPYLKNQYSTEMVEVLVPALEKEGEHSEGRSQYKNLVKKMQFLIKDFPESKQKILEVAKKLKVKYPRRPAMLEELNKLF
ncbi:SWIM zinc finger domain-containing protein [Flavobacterium sp. LS2P90]|uniref:SWIM zinc finger domain-containing protein n=1 Tax=Flavobacterium xylosi TaxID=3230415 RepID=A0ABW6HWQ1_9FLAO